MDKKKIDENNNNNNKELLYAIQGAKIHKNVGKKVRTYLRPNLTLKEIANFIETEIKIQTGFNIDNPIDKGIGFPTGLSINNLAAHYTPNYNEPDIIFKESDIIKIDYGVQFNGTIIDSAFTYSFNPEYQEFINISRNLTNYATSLCGIDVILGEIGREIEEYVNSKEIEINGKIKNIKIMRDLCGHKIAPYKIHDGKAVPNVKIFYPLRMQESEFYAIEPFITTGNGISIIKDQEANSHYMVSDKIDINSKNNIGLNKSDKLLYNFILKNYSTLPFCSRWIHELYEQKIIEIYSSLNTLVSKNILNEYPPIYDIEGSIISQFEHTIYIKDNGIINLTKNDYY
jgi:methionyl aminopeptidase